MSSDLLTIIPENFYYVFYFGMTTLLREIVAAGKVARLKNREDFGRNLRHVISTSIKFDQICSCYYPR